MGTRMRVHTRHKVEYGDGVLNNAAHLLENDMSDREWDGVWQWTLDGDMATLEILFKDMEEYLTELKSLEPEDWKYEKEGLALTDAIEAVEYMLAHGDRSNEWLYATYA